MKHLLAGDVCRILEIAPKTLDNWVTAGVIRPAINERGTGHHRRFAVVPDVVAIAVGRGLRAAGYTLAVAGNVMERLMSMTREDLDFAFAQGRYYLLIIPGVQDVSDHLVTRETLIQAMTLNPPLAHQLGLTPVGLDIKRVYDNVMREIETIDSREAVRAGSHKKTTV